MKKHNVFCLLVIFQVTLTFAQTSTFPFFNGTFEAFQATARDMGQSSFLVFTTPASAPCTRLMQETFTDPQFIQYVNARYLVYKAELDGSRGEGRDLAKTYQVMFFPTVVIFNPEGEVQHKFTGFKSASDFRQLLEQYQHTPFPATAFEEAPATELASAAEDVIYTDLDVLADARPNMPPPIIMDQAKTNREEKAFVERPASPSPVTPAGNEVKKDKGLFRISVSPQLTQGFGLQLGVYREYANVLREVQRLEQAGHQNVLVNVGSLMGKSVFKIVIGPFDSRAQADAYRSRMTHKEDKKGIIVDLSKYK
ncbi:MAG: hypothetical protein D6730_24650 [Bacteroidetes bacterium]|nr:MAG: hypothetical protein D6730_24650 [Bacteroidota bacterium]